MPMQWNERIVIWPKDAIDAWYEEGWDKEKLKEKKCPHPDFDTYFDYWESPQDLINPSDPREVLSEDRYWGKDWWIEFPEGSGRKYTPYHLPLSDRKTGELSPKHPHYEGPRGRFSNVELLTRGLTLRAYNGKAPTSYSYNCDPLENNTWISDCSNDRRTLLDGCVIHGDFKVGTEPQPANFTARMYQLFVVGAFSFTDARFHDVTNIQACAVGGEFRLRTCQVTAPIWISSIWASRFALSLNTISSFIHLEESTVLDLHLDSFKRNANELCTISIQKLNVLQSAHISSGVLQTLVFRECDFLPEVTVTSIESAGTIGFVDCTLFRQLSLQDCRAETFYLDSSRFFQGMRMGDAQIETLSAVDSLFLSELAISKGSIVEALALSNSIHVHPIAFREGAIGRNIDISRSRFCRFAEPLKIGMHRRRIESAGDNYENEILKRFHQNIDLEKSKWAKRPAWDSTATMYESRLRQFRLHLEQIGDHNGAGKVQASELFSRIRRSDVEPLEKAVTLLYFALSRFGRSIALILGHLLVSIPLVLGLLYTWLGMPLDSGQANHFIAYLYAPTFNPFADLGSSRFVPLGDLESSHPIVTLSFETLHRSLNAVALFLLALIIRRKFQIT